MKDAFGREVKAGDTIAYAGTSGRSAVLSFYRVEAVKEDLATCREFLKGWKRTWQKDKLVDDNFNSRRVGLSSSSRMMIIPGDMLDHLST